MSEINKFRIEVAIDKAYEEFQKLEDDQKHTLSAVLLARKYAPKTAGQVVDCLAEDKLILYMGQPQGHLLIDGFIAAVGEMIGAEIWKRHSEQLAKDAGQKARNRIIVP